MMKFIEIAQHRDWVLIIAGDLKTPHESYREFESSHVYYLHPLEQEKRWKELSDLVGWNCIQRRNFAFLHAHYMGAEIIATVDDDNIPNEDWGNNLLINKPVQAKHYTTSRPVFDPLYATFNYHLWHRGFPLEEICKRNGDYVSESVGPFHVQADFWNGDPDVDAICRLRIDPSFEFQNFHFPFAANKPSPFNSQNTFLSKEVLPHYFMHVDVGRWDDVVASYYVQAKGFKVIYGKPSVRQIRHEHDVMEDFKKELWGYQNTLAMVNDLQQDPNNLFNYLTPRAAQAFRKYQSYFE